MSRKRFFVNRLVVILVFAVLLPSSLLAHTNLIASIPADKAVLADSPEDFHLSFGDSVRLMRLTLTDEKGNKTALNYRPNGIKANQHQHRLPEMLPSGRYLLEWSVMADDGHNMTGHINFVVNTGEPSQNKENKVQNTSH